MIKINDKIWAVTHTSRAPLAYMCQVTEKADGTPDAATLKMQDTGRRWAEQHWGEGEKKGTTEAFYDNVPVKGVMIGDSVNRWTTDNKLFRVVDPRGFEVEVPTGNIAALLKYCTVEKGVIQQECVWGREGGSHLLLPVGTPPYNEAKKVIEKVAAVHLKATDLKVGDRVTLMNQGDILKTQYEYLGQVKFTWERKGENNRYRSSWGSRYDTLVESTPLEAERIKDDKWLAVFKLTYSHTCWYLSAELNPKILERVPGEPTMVLDAAIADDKLHYPPERVKNRFKLKVPDYQSVYHERRVVVKDTIVDIEFRK